MESPSSHTGPLCVLVVLPELQEAAAPAPWQPPLLAELAAQLGGDLVFHFLAPASDGETATWCGWPVHRFPSAPDAAAPARGATLLERCAGKLGRAAASAFWSAGARRAAALARERRFDLVHAHWPVLTGMIARAAGLVQRTPLVASSSILEVEGAVAEPALLARLRREWETCDLLLAEDEAALDAIRRHVGRHADLLPPLAGGDGHRPAAALAEALLDAWERAVLRGAVRSCPGGNAGAEFRNRY